MLLPVIRWAKKPSQQLLKHCWAFCFTFPNHNYPPTGLFQRRAVLRITPHIALKLWRPVVRPAFGVGRQLAPVPVPEAPVDKNHSPVLWQHQIRLARQPLIMQPEPQPEAMRGGPHQHFGLGVLGLDTGHEPAAQLGSQGVHLQRVSHSQALLAKGDTALAKVALFPYNGAF